MVSLPHPHGYRKIAMDVHPPKFMDKKNLGFDPESWWKIDENHGENWMKTSKSWWFGAIHMVFTHALPVVCIYKAYSNEETVPKMLSLDHEELKKQ